MALAQVKASYHARSVSLPSTPHPSNAQFDEQLCRLRSSQAACTSSSPSLTHRLKSITQLYRNVDEMLQLPSNQQSNSQIQVMLDGSLRLLDICSTSRDVLLQSKERIHDIQSVLRRRCSGELNISSEVAEYLNARKTVKKEVKTCMKNIKESGKNNETTEAEDIAVDILMSLLSYIGGSKSQCKKTWSAVAKFIQKKSENGAAVAQPNDFDAVDTTLESLLNQKKTHINADDLRNQMATLESEIEELDQELVLLFRHLVNNRATLLNIVSN